MDRLIQKVAKNTSFTFAIGFFTNALALVSMLYIFHYYILISNFPQSYGLATSAAIVISLIMISVLIQFIMIGMFGKFGAIGITSDIRRCNQLFKDKQGKGANILELYQTTNKFFHWQNASYLIQSFLIFAISILIHRTIFNFTWTEILPLMTAALCALIIGRFTCYCGTELLIGPWIQRFYNQMTPEKRKEAKGDFRPVWVKFGYLFLILVLIVFMAETVDKFRPISPTNLKLFYGSTAFFFLFVIVGILGPMIQMLTKLANAFKNLALGRHSVIRQYTMDREFMDLSHNFHDAADEILRYRKTLHLALHRLRIRLRATQQEIVRSETFAGIGYLASGIAHELNNPLAIISGYQEELSEDTESGKITTEALEDAIGKILYACNRMNRIIEQLNLFIDPKANKEEELDPNEIVRELVSNFSDELSQKQINYQQNLCNTSRFLGNHAHILRALQNVLINAIQATEGKDHKEIIIETDQIDNYIVFRISDSGGGISQDQLKKVFVPFYTTKGPDKGSGLGLSIVYSIVQFHQGKMNIDITKEGRTTFEIRLPSNLTSAENYSA